MTTNKRLMVLATAVLGVTLLGPVQEAQAQEVQLSGPLAGAPAVMNMRLYRKNRVEVKPFAGITLDDQFSRTMFTGGQLTYHFTDWIGIGVFGALGAAHLDTSLTDQVAAKGQTSDNNLLDLPSRQNFTNQIGRLNWMGGAQVTFIPLRGKMGLFERLFVDTDFYLSGGVAMVGIEERADIALGQVCPGALDNACRDTLAGIQGSSQGRASRTAVAPTLAAGLSLYLADFLALNIEWRALPFSWNTGGTDVAGAGPGGNFPDGRIDTQDRQFQFNHMISLGLAFFLPTSAEVTHTAEETKQSLSVRKSTRR
jgi:outer membrane beta-barrel protein